MLFATATGAVDADYDRPLFKLLLPIRLRPWTIPDCLAYFDRSRALDNKQPLDDAQRAKASAVAEFIGGTPRLAYLLAEVLESDDALTVAETMNALAGKLAEYYRRRIEDLAPFARGLLDELIRGGEPASATELARRVEADGQNAIAQYMRMLTATDVLRGEKARDSRETLYHVTDRVMAHYYRLRQGSEAARATPLATILDFLRSYYSREERKAQAWKFLQAGRPAEAGVFARLAMEGVRGDFRNYERQFAYRLEIYAEAAPGAFEGDAAAMAARVVDDPAGTFHRLREVVAGGPAAAVVAVLRARALVAMGQPERAGQELAQARSLGDPVALTIAICESGNLAANVFRDSKESARIGMALESLGAQHLPARLDALRERDLAWNLAELGEFSGSEERAAVAAQKARDASDPLGEAIALRYRSYSLAKLGRLAEAVDVAAEAAARAREAGDAREEAISLQYQAYSLRELGRWDEAMSAALARLSLARVHNDARNLSWAALELLRVAVKRPHGEAVVVYREWLDAYRTTADKRDFADPRFEMDALLLAAERAGVWAQLDETLDNAFAVRPRQVFLIADKSLGAGLAGRAPELGRSGTFASAIGLLRRRQRLEKLQPRQSPHWTVDFAEGFASNCRDPDLLDDIAGLLTHDLAAEAPRAAALLRAIAEVDAAADKQAKLQRMDPDLATVIRRLRDLPAPSTEHGAKSKKARKRKDR
jgi:hypothetical protein